MDLKDTAELMCSFDYKERFIAEYKQLQIRVERLDNLIAKMEAGTLDFEPKCPIDILMEQKQYMSFYLHCLKVRSEIEGINLGD